VYQLADRVKLNNQPFQGDGSIQFRHLASKTPKDNTKNLILNTLHKSHGTLTEYERDFLVDIYYNESTDLGIARNELAHNIYDATRGFQSIDWRELAQRLIVSIAFLNEKVVCIYSPVDTAKIQMFEEWLSQREKAGFENLQTSQ